MAMSLCVGYSGSRLSKKALVKPLRRSFSHLCLNREHVYRLKAIPIQRLSKVHTFCQESLDSLLPEYRRSRSGIYPRMITTAAVLYSFGANRYLKTMQSSYHTGNDPDASRTITTRYRSRQSIWIGTQAMS